MDTLRKTITATGYNLYYSISNPKIWAALVLILTVAFVDFNGFILMVGDFDLPISIGAICGLFSDQFFVMIVFVGLLLIFSELPFNDSQQTFMVTRSGKRAWCISQILYIIVVSAFVMLAILLFSMLLFAGHLTFDDSWGKIIPAANTEEILKKYPISIIVSSYVMASLTPQEALAIIIPIALLSFISYGTMVFALNMVSRKIAGTVVAAIFITLNAVVDFLTFEWFPWITMLRWCSIERINFAHSGTNPTPEHAYIMLSGIFVLSVAAALFGSRKKSDVL